MSGIKNNKYTPFCKLTFIEVVDEALEGGADGLASVPIVYLSFNNVIPELSGFGPA